MAAQPVPRFRAEADFGSSLIILNRDIGKVGCDACRFKVPSEEEMLTHCGANSFIIGRPFVRSQRRSKSQGTRRDGGFCEGTFSSRPYTNCSAIFVRAGH